MFRGDLIIDGYNVLHAASLAPPSGKPHGLEHARQSMLRLIAGQLTPRERYRTTVVFDAPVQFMGPSPPKEVHELLVLFAGEDGDADAAIERLIRQNSAPRRLCVVSSDHRLQKAARRRRAKFLDSEDFLRRLDRRSSRPRRRDGEGEPAIKHAGRLPPGEVEAWLRVFDDVEDVRSPSDLPDNRHPPPTATDPPLPPPRAARNQISTPHRSKRTKPAANDPGSDSTDEISFWESRISELDKEEP